MSRDLASKDSSKNISIIDLGSNSLRMIVVRVVAGGATFVLNQVKYMVQLGENAFESHALQPEATKRTIEILSSFAETLQAYNVEECIAIATAAVRDADNGQEFLDDVFLQTGIRFTCISGREEARLIYLGVSEEFEQSAMQRFYLDIGGGSTEFIVGDSHSYRELDSVKLGCVRLANKFVPADPEGRVSEKEYAQMQDYVRSVGSHTLARMAKFFPQEMIASSGTALTLTAIASFLDDAPQDGSQKHVLSYKNLCRVVKELCKRSDAERKEMQGINPRRSQIIIQGAAILQTVMEELGFDSLNISHRGLRDGILRDYLERATFFTENYGTNVQEQSILKLARLCRFEENHAQHVAKLALRMFDTAKQCELHSLDRKARQFLYYGALVHDIGIFISYSGHDAHGHYLVKNFNLLGFTQSEVDVLAALVFMHRMKNTRACQHFMELKEEHKPTVDILSVFLKCAEAMERSHSQLIEDVRFECDGDVIKLVLYHSKACPLEVKKIEGAKKMLKKFFDKEIELEWVCDTTA